MKGWRMEREGLGFFFQWGLRWEPRKPNLPRSPGRAAARLELLDARPKQGKARRGRKERGWVCYPAHSPTSRFFFQMRPEEFISLLLPSKLKRVYFSLPLSLFYLPLFSLKTHFWKQWEIPAPTGAAAPETITANPGVGRGMRDGTAPLRMKRKTWGWFPWHNNACLRSPSVLYFGIKASPRRQSWRGSSMAPEGVYSAPRHENSPQEAKLVPA